MAAKGLAPLVYKLQGQAEGFAAASGANSVQPEHLLLALLWEPHGRHAYLLKTLRVPRARVQRRLAAAGVAVPPRLPPRSDDTRWGEFVTIRLPSSDAWQLAGLITRLLPHGAPFAFNFGGGKAWFRTGSGIDLAPLIRKARRRQLERRRAAQRSDR